MALIHCRFHKCHQCSTFMRDSSHASFGYHLKYFKKNSDISGSCVVSRLEISNLPVFGSPAKSTIQARQLRPATGNLGFPSLQWFWSCRKCLKPPTIQQGLRRASNGDSLLQACRVINVINELYDPPSNNQLLMVRKYRLSLFWGALSLYSVLFKSTLNNSKMPRNWLHGFRSLNCWEWIKVRSLSLRLQPCWGAI